MLTTREIIKTLYNALIQRLKKHRGNWEQNDPTADDYIKNRPFYTDDSEKVVIVPNQQITFSDYEAALTLSEIIEFVVGQSYEVKWDNVNYTCIAWDFNGIGAIGNQGMIDGLIDTGEPFVISISKAEGMGMAMSSTTGTHTVEVTSAKIVKIDKKYLPDFAPVATSGSYDDLTDTPTIYTDVVRYDTSQSLTTAQENQARNNIGAASSLEVSATVKYNGVQNLTSAQKLQARTNIGAISSDALNGYLPVKTSKENYTFSFTQDKVTSGRDKISVNAWTYYKVSDIVRARTDYISCTGVFTVVTPTTTSNKNYSAGYSNFNFGTNCFEPISGVVVVEKSGTCVLPISSTANSTFSAPSAGIYAMYHIQSNGYSRWCQSVNLIYKDEFQYIDVLAVNSENGIYKISVNSDGNILTEDQDGNIVISGNSNSVRYDVAQSLTEEQKITARNNIGAGTSSFSGSYNDLSNKPIIPDIDATLSVEGDAADAKATGDAINNLTDLISTPKNAIFFIDQINGYKYVACMRDGNFITYCAIKNIEVTSMPSKTEYIAGDYFDPTGMVVSAVAYDGTTKEIVDYTLPESYLTNGTTYVEISYIEAGLIYTANVPITVNEFDPAVVLVDFEYTANNNGTYTITGWKGTYNGESSTEMIIPNNGLIIV